MFAHAEADRRFGAGGAISSFNNSNTTGIG
jgi:hypothetical protein